MIACKPDRPAEDAPEYAADHRHDDEEEEQDHVERNAARLALRRLHRRRVRQRLALVDHGDDLVDPRIDALRELVVAKQALMIVVAIRFAPKSLMNF